MNYMYFDKKADGEFESITFLKEGEFSITCEIVKQYNAYSQERLEREELEKKQREKEKFEEERREREKRDELEKQRR